MLPKTLTFFQLDACRGAAECTRSVHGSTGVSLRAVNDALWQHAFPMTPLLSLASLSSTLQALQSCSTRPKALRCSGTGHAKTLVSEQCMQASLASDALPTTALRRPGAAVIAVGRRPHPFSRPLVSHPLARLEARIRQSHWRAPPPWRAQHQPSWQPRARPACASRAP